MQQKLVIIGGGEMKYLETLPFDKRIVALTNKKRPRALFIPTASYDSKRYAKQFEKIYAKKLGCDVDVLYLLDAEVTPKIAKQKIQAADLIYVGGGNTLKMMKRWRYLGVDKMLKQVHKKGTVLSGISAGGICWFDAGHSDSMSFYSSDSWNYIKVSGLGILQGIHCPHFNGHTNGVRRKKHFLNFMKQHSGVGICIDNHCAIEFYR